MDTLRMRSARSLALVGLCIMVVLGVITLSAQGSDQPITRIKDITRVDGVRDNQLVGLGLVVGLNGTGDSRGAQVEMVANMLERFQIAVDPSDLRARNVAVVTVTADLGAFARQGDRIDVTVSSIGDARSLQGGFLLMTPLQAANGEVYAVAQGPVSIGGLNVRTGGAGVQQNHAVVGRIANGAIVERDAPGRLAIDDRITLLLHQPDFTTASRIAAAINEAFLPDTARALDWTAVEVTIPGPFRSNPVEFLALVEELTVTPDQAARVVINERTGTIVIGHNVRISTVAVSHGNLSVKIQTERTVSQPPPLSSGETTVVSEATIEITEGEGRMMVLPATVNVEELVSALNAIGASPRDIISILQAIKAAGALYGELEVL